MTRPAYKPSVFLAMVPLQLPTDSLKHATHSSGGILEGSRNAHLASLAGTMRGRGMTQLGIEAGLLAENQGRCNPPLPDYEVKAIAASIASYAAGTNQCNKAQSRFRLIRAAEMELKAPDWLIRGFIERNTLVVVYGDFGCCKSFLALDMSFNIGGGIDFHGHRARQGAVIYIAGEGFSGLARRRTAWSMARGATVENVYFSNMPAALLDTENMAGVFAAIDTIVSQTANPALVVLDTVQRNFGPGDENSTADMTRFVAACDEIRARYECAVLVVHHTGHSDKSRTRGSIVLPASVETAIRLDKDDTGVVRVEFTKMKDGGSPEPMAFRLRSVELPLKDDEGQPITSAVLDRVSYEPPAKPGKVGRGKWQANALEILHTLLDHARREKENAGMDPATARVPLDDWRKACVTAGIPRQRFKGVQEGLAKAGQVRINHGFVMSGFVSCPVSFIGKPDKQDKHLANDKKDKPDANSTTNRTQTGRAPTPAKSKMSGKKPKY